MKTPFGDWIYPPTPEEIEAVLQAYMGALQRKREAEKTGEAKASESKPKTKLRRKRDAEQGGEKTNPDKKIKSGSTYQETKPALDPPSQG